MEEILNAARIQEIMEEQAEIIHQSVADWDNFVIVGIHTRGVEIGKRMKVLLEERSGHTIPLGIIDITFYRDDLGTRGALPEVKETNITFDISDREVLLVDDVIYSGRSVKAALETLMSFGRPGKIRLFTLVDRGHRDLPIQPDFFGYRIETDLEDRVDVLLRETDGTDDRVVVTRAAE
jgi:pyrimidine operon attenuation protein/uracil phosphoribosyltransferase